MEEAGRIADLPRSGDSFRLGTAPVAVCMQRRRLSCLLSIVSAVLGLAASTRRRDQRSLDHSSSNTVDRQYMYCHSTLIHLVVCLTTGPKPLPKRALHIVRSRASSFKWGYPLLSLRSSNSFLRLLPCLPVTSIPPCIFPSVTHCKRQFLRKMWPIQFAFRLRISCRIFLEL